MEFERWAWTAKHMVPMKTYVVECPNCELKYHMEATELSEVYCPLCESEEPIKVTVARDTKSQED